MTSAPSQSFEHAFAYCPICGTANPTPGSIPFQCKKCHFAFYFGPVAAVAALIVDEQRRVLLVRRSCDPGKGKWGVPGGFIDRGESAEQALSREILEETQLVLNDCELFLTAPNRYTFCGVTADVIDLFFLCHVKSPAPIQLAPSELCEFKWCVPGPELLDEMAFASNRIAIEHWLSRR